MRGFLSIRHKLQGASNALQPVVLIAVRGVAKAEDVVSELLDRGSLAVDGVLQLLNKSVCANTGSMLPSSP